MESVDDQTLQLKHQTKMLQRREELKQIVRQCQLEYLKMGVAIPTRGPCSDQELGKIG